MGTVLFFIVTGVLNFAGGFALAMMLDLGPRSWGDVLCWCCARRATVRKG
ncbi:MAG: hypothetical protein GYA33_11805 [Thermogutta sp.]|nr:hypothetical protein [Thermogutta sp.]